MARPEAASGCNECNEALDMAREVMAKARRLALVVQNALLNADLQRACSVLRDLQIAMSTTEVHVFSTALISSSCAVPFAV